MSLAPSCLDDGRRRHPSALRGPLAVKFAHPSERVFAALLDLHDIDWLYEPIEFPLSWGERGAPRSGFRPDFWLPQEGCFIELTTAEQRLVTRKNAKLRRCRELYPEVTIHIVYQRDFNQLLERHGIAPDSLHAA
jgi:hypothetical protein